MILIDKEGDAWKVCGTAYGGLGWYVRIRDAFQKDELENASIATARDLLEASIRKWQHVKPSPERACLDAATCPLCTMFITNSCNGCPVYAKTGQVSCHGTPYGVCSDESRQNLLTQESIDAEIKFLESCREFAV